MKRRTFIGSLGMGALSGLELVQRMFAEGKAYDGHANIDHAQPDVDREVANERQFKVLPGQRIILQGDSISKGFAFGNYTDPSPLRTLYGMAQILMKQNLSRPPEWIWAKPVWDGFKPDGITPKTVDTLAGEVQVQVRNGTIRTGDWMIYEDGGGLDNFVHPAPWPSTKNIYENYRRSLRDMFLEAKPWVGLQQIRCMTMFDYDPKYPGPWAQWDVPLDDGLHTGNDAIRDEANALGVQWIDMNRIMDRAEDYIVARGWGRMVGPDGIHPNVYGNFVMILAILDSLGADIALWKIDGLYPHFHHPQAGGDVATVWGFHKDPTDEERIGILNDLREIVAREVAIPPQNRGQIKRSKGSGRECCPTAHTFCSLRHHGRILSQTATQPTGTSRPVSYELGKLFQLDKERVLLVASMREQGGHDFEVGNDGFIFKDPSDIDPKKAIPINRLEPNYKFKLGVGTGVLAKFDAVGAFTPIGARLENGAPHPAAGTGFLLSVCQAYTADRSDATHTGEQFLEFLQLKYENGQLKVIKSSLPEDLLQKINNCGFNCVAKGANFLCPLVSDDGIVVVDFSYDGDQWKPARVGKPFVTARGGPGGRAYQPGGEIEPSIHKTADGYVIYTRSHDWRGRVYRSLEGLDYYLVFDHYNYEAPQVLNQGLDGSLYLVTNTGPRSLRNPLLAYAMQGQTFIDPVVIHDEKEIGDDRGPEVPFVDHCIANNVFLNGRWRHLICYRVLDLRETNGEGAPPTPHTGLYLAELEYDSITQPPVRF